MAPTTQVLRTRITESHWVMIVPFKMFKLVGSIEKAAALAKPNLKPITKRDILNIMVRSRLYLGLIGGFQLVVAFGRPHIDVKRLLIG